MVGVEACYGFGDGLFLAPLIKRIAERHGGPVEMAVQAQCADAFHNLPWVAKITHVNNLHDGMALFRDRPHSYQITPNVYFPSFKESHPDHSLIDTARGIGRHYGLGDFDQRPIFLPSREDLEVRVNLLRPVIAVESHYKSGQSWADKNSFKPILDKYGSTHDVLWLSNQDAPNHPNVHTLKNCSRRQVITLLSKAETFFSVGSGFFCASLALEVPPQRIVCLWLDHFYCYERRLAELGWHQNIKWVHNMDELRANL